MTETYRSESESESESAHDSQCYPYLPHTKEERQEMLEAIGVKTFEELIKHIPADVRAKTLDLKPGLSELELVQHVKALALKNKPVSEQISFLGGGSYRRFVPAVVPAIVSRSEFATAYTPYQPEVSQGSLQAIYEFQTAICLLTGMEVANASMYDGPTACAEAALMASRLTQRHTVVAAASINPEYAMVTETYADSCGLTFKSSPQKDGVVSVADRSPQSIGLDQETACLIVQYPNYFGCLENLEELARACHDAGALLVVVSDPISLGALTAPGDFGADIVVGDAQSCGNFLSFGGPSAGYMACRKDFIRQLPGRLAGMTVDNRGNRAFTLTLQTREQHIRRARATSNICTNQALNALTMLVYLCMLGPKGLHDLTSISMERAHYLAEQLCQIDGVKMRFDRSFVNEFVIELSEGCSFVVESLKEVGILAGIELGKEGGELSNCLLVSVTEMNAREDLDKYIKEFKRVMSAKTGSQSPSKGERRSPAMAAKSHQS